MNLLNWVAENTHTDTINLGIGLIILMGVNIIMGTVNSLFDTDFDTRKCLKGIAKAAILISCFSAIYLAGILNETTLSISFGPDTPVNIIDAMHALLLAGYFTYSKQVVKKMGSIIGITKGNDKDSQAVTPSDDTGGESETSHPPNQHLPIEEEGECEYEQLLKIRK